MSRRKKVEDKMPKEKDALGYLRKVQDKFQNEPLVYNHFLDIMKDFKSQAIDTDGVIERVKTLFHGNTALILGFNQFLPPGYKIEMDEPQQLEEHHAVQYVVKIKHRFRNQPEIYAEFLDILHEYQAKRTVDEVYARVQKLFGNEPDLLDEFKYFLPDTAAIVRPKKKFKKDKRGSTANSSSSTGRGSKVQEDRSRSLDENFEFPPGTEQEQAFFQRLKSHVTQQTWTQFLHLLDIFTRKIISRPELVYLASDLFPKSDYVDKFKNAIQYDEWEERRFQANRNHYYSFIQSVDYTTCKQISPSYRQLPSSVIVPPCSGRGQLEQDNLNDTAISITAGSEDFSFKATRKNTYEEALFKAEDERFELDMLIENNAATIAVLQPTADKLKEMSTEQSKRLRLKNLDILNIRAIAKLYGNSALDIISSLNTNAASAVPVVLNRLKQKDKEWRKVKADMRVHWRRINDQNYHRSLDHRSFYFKQEDKKRRTGKVLIQELRDLQSQTFGGERTREEIEDEINNTILAALKEKSGEPLFNYSLRFKYNSESVHSLLFEIITRTARTFVKDDVIKQIHDFLLYFVNHVLNVQLDPILSNNNESQLSLAALMVPEHFNGKEPTCSSSSVKHNETQIKFEEELQENNTANALLDMRNEDAKIVSSLNMGGKMKTKKMIPIVSDDQLLGKLPEIYNKLNTPISSDTVQSTRYNVPENEQNTPMRAHTRPSRMFIANAPFYTFFRLHRFLYERLHLAKELAMKERSVKNKKIPATGTERYVKFLQLLEQLLEGTKESSRFEDSCRTLLGASSYTLFTIDKLVASAIKQIIAIISSPLCADMMGLYQREFLAQKVLPQPLTLVQSKSLAEAYHYRASQMISHRENNDETSLCQMEFFEDSQELCFALIDVLAQPGLGKMQGVFETSTKEWTDYFMSLVTETNDVDRIPYLNRNLKRARPLSNDITMSNDLEVFLGPNRTNDGLRLWYFNGTEDVFVRTDKHGKRAKKNDDRSNKWNEIHASMK